ncbi:MAG: hypothetical protein Q8K55_08020 [Gemmatimonadaceae bacterium]|nr:hypothetical protein [Gemmatimonadaceae bacterium]
MRTALAAGVLAISVPALAQSGRSGGDRSRADRGNEARSGRVEKGGNQRAERRTDGQAQPRAGSVIGGGRVAPRGGSDVGGGRVAPRGGSGVVGGRVAPNGGTVIGGGRVAPRGGVPEAQQGRRDPRVGVPDGRYERRDRPDQPRVVVRPPVVNNRYDNRAPRAVPRPYGRAVGYRYGDRDFRHREVLRISMWYRSLPPARLSYYGYYDRYDRSWGGVRFVFRPGLHLTFDVFTRLAVLPYDLELELGELPWYLERRIYGNTVLVIDTRTRYIVDIFEIDY